VTVWAEASGTASTMANPAIRPPLMRDRGNRVMSIEPPSV
jgi:hypothetical protein